MRILLVNHYAGSERLGMEYRPFYFAREWVRRGCRVTILAASYSHLRMRQPEVTRDLADSEEEGVRFRWLRVNEYAGNGGGRIVNILTFVGKALAAAARLAREERPDAVICSSTYPLDIYPGARIARLASARLVFEVHDLWPLTPVLVGGYSPRHPFIRVLQRAEDDAYRLADAVVSLLPDADRHMRSRGMDPAKFAYVPNGVDTSLLAAAAAASLPADVERAIAMERAAGRFLVGYAGGINLSNCFDQIIDAAERLGGHGISILAAGHGNELEAMRQKCAARRIDNVRFLGWIDKRLIQAFLSRMDALVMVFKDSPLYVYGISPNKLFEYMLSGRPVVQAVNASNDLVSASGCGLTVAPGDPAALAEALLAISRSSPEARAEIGENGRRFVCREHDYRVLADRFLSTLQGDARPPALASAIPQAVSAGR